jgi:glycosyltransferase involved in cell wall biosynthesis
MTVGKSLCVYLFGPDYGPQRDRIETIYLGAEKSSCELTGNDVRVFKESVKLRGEISLLLFVGKVDDRRKGLDLLLKALKIVAEQTSAVLLVIGPGNQSDASNIAASFGISEKVFFLGSADPLTLQKCCAICDVYVFPLRLEGFGLLLLEVTESAKPIVAPMSPHDQTR